MIPRSLLRGNIPWQCLQMNPPVLRAPPASVRLRHFPVVEALPSKRHSSGSTSNSSSSDTSNAKEHVKPSDTASDGQSKTTEHFLKEELEAKNKEIVDLKDKYLRSVADFRNLQDRTARDISAARDFAISRFAKDLLDSVDNFDRALSTVPASSLTSEAPNKELRDLHSGLKMTESVLIQTLAKNGLERFDPSESEDKFDPNLHEATFMTKVEGKKDGTVFNTIQKGFKLNGRVIRAAKVGVVKNG